VEPLRALGGEQLVAIQVALSELDLLRSSVRGEYGICSSACDLRYVHVLALGLPKRIVATERGLLHGGTAGFYLWKAAGFSIENLTGFSIEKRAATRGIFFLLREAEAAVYRLLANDEETSSAGLHGLRGCLAGGRTKYV